MPLSSGCDVVSEKKLWASPSKTDMDVSRKLTGTPAVE